MDRFITLKLGKDSEDDARVITIDREDVTPDQIGALHKACQTIQNRHSIEAKYPRIEIVEEEPQLDDNGLPVINEAGETQKVEVKRLENDTEWQIRVLLAKFQRQDGEDQVAYMDRVHSAHMEMHLVSIAFDLVKEIAIIFEQGTVSKEEYGCTSYRRIKNFCFDVLEEAEVKYEAFREKFRTSDRPRNA